MIQILAAVLLSLVASPVFAQAGPEAAPTCRWAAAMEEDEGGPVMVASACATSPTEFAPIRLMCAQGVDLRLYPGPLLDETFEILNARLDFAFSGGADNIWTIALAYEDFDGAYATAIAPNDPLLDLLRSASQVAVVETSGRYAPMQIDLAGSSAAIATLLRSCP